MQDNLLLFQKRNLHAVGVSGSINVAHFSDQQNY